MEPQSPTSKANSRYRFFIALLPPSEMQDKANEIKQYFSDRYHSRAAQKSPPHITLQPPFEWPAATVADLQTSLMSFAMGHSAIPIALSGFGSFPPRVIYINVLKTPELMALQQALAVHMEAELDIVDRRSQHRSFAPHMTVAFRDLKPRAFKQAWLEFETRSLQFQFMADQLTLLIHTGQRWTVSQVFPFGRLDR
ncbi:MAG: 2'-5' RNA ligase family protein [Leptolyngbyaceae cyanobacterium MO_188.B28]|nr:2'-5' RNA ligase family protein [Leptolyngbyaceae cyanobacterium MO_188.B28]